MTNRFVTLVSQLGVKALTVEDLLQARKEISAHNRQLKEQTKQLERDMALLRDHSLLLVRARSFVTVVVVEATCYYSLVPGVYTCSLMWTDSVLSPSLNSVCILKQTEMMLFRVQTRR